jgi:hypothetical protein
MEGAVMSSIRWPRRTTKVNLWLAGAYGVLFSLVLDAFHPDIFDRGWPELFGSLLPGLLLFVGVGYINNRRIAGQLAGGIEPTVARSKVRLSGWQRIGIVLSVIWLLTVLTVWFFQRFDGADALFRMQSDSCNQVFDAEELSAGPQQLN